MTTSLAVPTQPTQPTQPADPADVRGQAMRHGIGDADSSAHTPGSDLQLLSDLAGAAGRKNMLLLIQLRWIAVIGQIVTIAFVFYALRIQLPLQPMLAVLGILLAFNVVSLMRWRGRRRFSQSELFVSMLVDVAMLTTQLYLSGGASNPFVFLYLLQVTLGAVLLKPSFVWSLLAVTASCFAGLARFAHPLALPPDQDLGLSSLYIQGTLICFALNAVLLVIFITRIGKNVRERDARLARLRQRAAEEEHIVRMGLLASGAAHELGTPLATLAVILGDWRRMPAFASDGELLQEVAEMETQLKRCKTIVSGILLSAGETRGESSAATTITTFMDSLVEEWRHTRVRAALHYDNQFGQDLPVVSDSAVKQMIFNVLDNALESSGQWLHLAVAREAGNLVLRCTDRGPGFAPATLAQFGKPYNSTKGRPGGGLGLFLVVNVARTLGGVVSASNPPEGGACVTITLPLAALVIDGSTDEDSDER
jgi:two-component system sensor histidine kinase RegB